MGVPVSHVLISTCLNGQREFNSSTAESLLALMKELLAYRDYFAGFRFAGQSSKMSARYWSTSMRVSRAGCGPRGSKGGSMTDQQIKNEHRDRVVHACRLAINHAALLCGAMTQFVERLTSEDALNRPENLRKIEDCVFKLDSAELHLIQAVEKLYEMHRKKKQVAQHHYADLLILLWNGVGDCLDRSAGFSGPLQSGEQSYHEQVVLPLIQESLQIFKAQQRNLRNEANLAGCN
jgi:hypothetical protein